VVVINLTGEHLDFWLCRLGPASCLFNFRAFVADSPAVNGVVLNQVEYLRRESEFMLRDGQAAFLGFHLIFRLRISHSDSGEM